jgi:hypothetical protein
MPSINQGSSGHGNWRSPGYATSSPPNPNVEEMPGRPVRHNHPTRLYGFLLADGMLTRLIEERTQGLDRAVCAATALGDRDDSVIFISIR